MEITVIGAGIAGLTAAIAAAEEGQPVRLLEKRGELGGRARTLPPPYRANLGPHALYADGSHWQWLFEPGLLPATVGRGDERLLYSRQGELITPPPALRQALQRIVGQRAPTDRSFSCWAARLIGADLTQLLAGLAFIVTYDADPGRLSAAFVQEWLTRLVEADIVRYVVGGWQALIARLANRAAQLGVLIETRARVSQLPQPPVTVATPAAAARRLLGGSELRSEGARVALLDLALASETALPTGLLDLDERLYLAATPPSTAAWRRREQS